MCFLSFCWFFVFYLVLTWAESGLGPSGFGDRLTVLNLYRCIAPLGIAYTLHILIPQKSNALSRSLVVCEGVSCFIIHSFYDKANTN